MPCYSEDMKEEDYSIRNRYGGYYRLLLKLPEEMDIRIGALGRFTFKKGWYVYTGSAETNLIARLTRHHQSEKKLRWHIDYLLEYAEIWGTNLYTLIGNEECDLARAVLKWNGAEIPVPRFGASDCQCPAHLAYFRTRPSVKLFSE